MMNVSTLCLPCRYYHFAFLMVLSCPTEVLNFYVVKIVNGFL
jgi:hypothetical protein